MIKRFRIFITLILLSGNLYAQQVYKNLNPSVLGDGIISTSSTYDTHPSFSPSGKTLYFLRCAADISKSTIYYADLVKGKWTTPKVVSFSGKYFDADPFVTKDGKTMYFTSNRPIKAGDPARKDTDIWKVQWIDNIGWGKPTHLDFPFSSEGDEHYPTIADNGNMYFGSSRPGGFGESDLYRVKKNGSSKYIIENLGKEVNTANNEYEPFIQKDERFLLFMATIPNGLANADFYISYFRHGKWTPKEKIKAPINSSATEWAPKLSRDGKVLYFGSTRKRLATAKDELSDIYYISTAGLSFVK